MTEETLELQVIEKLNEIVLKIYNKNCNKFKTCGLENNSSVECENPYLDCFLLKNNVHEQALTHRIAHYLENKLKSFLKKNKLSIDCEYNRHINDPKTFFSEIINPILNKISNTSLNEDDLHNIYELFRPDIILHQRGDDAKNILIIECKKAQTINNNDVKFDFKKLKAFTCENGNFKYKIGVSIVFNNKHPILTYFFKEPKLKDIKTLLEKQNSKKYEINIYDDSNDIAISITDYIKNMEKTNNKHSED